MPSDYVKDLVDHKRRVAGYMRIVADDLFQRAAVHDNSKFSPEEYNIYEQVFPELQKYAFGSQEIKQAYEKLGPALQHHFQENRHHPEHHEHGIDDMTLVDVLEMVCDWLAASHRSKTGIGEGLEINKERFHIDDQLYGIIKNTVKQIAPQTFPQPTDPNTLYPDVLLAGENEEK